MSTQKTAKLRVCASCEWIFDSKGSCPLCGFASYGARSVYGDKAYQYKYTQKPWRDKQLANKAVKLDKTIREKNQFKKEAKIFNFFKIKGV